MTTVIKTHGLTKKYLWTEAVRDLDLQHRFGHAFALICPLGYRSLLLY